MRHRGLCEANVDAVTISPREHDARRMSGRRDCGLNQWPPVLGNGDWWHQSGRRPPYSRRSSSSRPRNQGSQWLSGPRLLHRWKQRAVIDGTWGLLRQRGTSIQSNSVTRFSLLYARQWNTLTTERMTTITAVAMDMFTHQKTLARCSRLQPPLMWAWLRSKCSTASLRIP